MTVTMGSLSALEEEEEGSQRGTKNVFIPRFLIFCNRALKTLATSLSIDWVAELIA
jgi:hypothetical protein